MMASLERYLLVLTVAALGAAPLAAGAQGAPGGTCRGCTREQAEAERRRAAQARRDLERAVDRARERVYELRESSQYTGAEARALRQAVVALEQAEPATPEFAMHLARLQALAAQQEARFFEDAKLKGALKDMSRLQGELAMRRIPRMQRGYLGVTFSSSRQVDRNGRVGFSFDQYPEILSVETDSPAEQAGVRRGDVLLALDGRDVVKKGPIVMSELLKPGETVKLRLRRGGRTREVPVKVGYAQEVRVFVAPGEGGGWATVAPMPPMPPTPPAAMAPLPPRVRVVPARPAEGAEVSRFVWSNDGVVTVGITMLGAQLQSMDRDQREALDADEGVLVMMVAPRSLAAKAGLRSLDVITSIDGDRATSPDDLRNAVDRANRNGADSVQLTVARKGKERKVVLRW